jgi:hypothetical protein
MTQTRPLVKSQENLTEFFRDQVGLATEKLDVQLDTHAEYYLVNLLNDFRRTEQLFEFVGDSLDDVPLAMMLERAVHGESLPTRIRFFKQLGDRALFVAGCFPERTSRHTNAEYYITMGSGAYSSLSTLFSTQDTFTDIFAELGDKFAGCVEVLTEVQRGGRQTNVDLIDFYERWLETGSDRLGRILEREGIPLTHKVKTTQ